MSAIPLELRRLLDAEARPSRPRRVDSRLTPDIWVEPRYVVEVLADEVTRSPLHACGQYGEGQGYAPRFPRMLGGVRDDEAAEDATTEREILELCTLQHVGSARKGRAKGRGNTTGRKHAGLARPARRASRG